MSLNWTDSPLLQPRGVSLQYDWLLEASMVRPPLEFLRFYIVVSYIAYHPERFGSFWTLGGEFCFAVLQWLALGLLLRWFWRFNFFCAFFAAYVAALSLERVTALGFSKPGFLAARSFPRMHAELVLEPCHGERKDVVARVHA